MTPDHILTRPVEPQGPRRERFALIRQPLRDLHFRRLLVGGRIADLGRLPRYFGVSLLGAAAIWAPITGYLRTTPPSYASTASLILPGSGASASVNLADIGQASSFANSAFSSNAVSPTETYKRLIGAERIVSAAARALDVPPSAFGKPRITLVDQTSFINLAITGATPEDARDMGAALLDAFFAEIERLRADELRVREDGGLGAIQEYRASVRETRDAIAALQTESGLLSAEQYRERVARNDALRTTLAELKEARAEKRQSVDSLMAQLGTNPAAAAASLKLFADREYIGLVETGAAQSATLSDARSRYGANHPAVRKAAASFAAAGREARSRAAELTGLSPQALEGLDLAPDGARAGLLAQLVEIEAERRGLNAKAAEMASRLDSESVELARLAPIAARLEDMQRDFAVAEAVFASAIARSQSTKADVYASYPLVQVLEDPSLPDAPSSPRKKLALVAGVAATFLLMIGLALGWVRTAMISRLLAGGEVAKS